MFLLVYGLVLNCNVFSFETDFHFKTLKKGLSFEPCKIGVNSSPNGKILDKSKLKAFPDNKLEVAEGMKILPYRIKPLWKKGENP